MFPSFRILALWLSAILLHNYIDFTLANNQYLLAIVIAFIALLNTESKLKVLFEHLVLFVFLFFAVALTMPKKDNALGLDSYETNEAFILVKKQLSQTSYSNRYLCEVKCLNRPVQTRVDETCILTLSQKEWSTKLYPGDQFYAKVRFSEILEPKHKYLFHAKNYWAKKGVYSRVWVSGIRMVSPSKNILLKLFSLQVRVKDLLNKQEISETAKQLIIALVLGDKKSVEREVLESFQALGLVHVLALSGMHIGLIYGICLLFLNIFFKHYPRLKALILICLIFSYAIFTGLNPSVFRASMMFFIYAVSVIINRPTSTMNIVSLSALIMLIVQSNYLFDLGFQLSYLAVFGILYFYGFYRDVLSSYSKITRFFLGLLFVSLSAQIATGALSAYYFGVLPLSFLWANVLVLPLISLLLYWAVFYIVWLVVIGESSLLNNSIDLLFEGLINWLGLVEKYSIKAISVSLTVEQVCFYYGFLVLCCVIILEAKYKFIKLFYFYIILAFCGFVFFQEQERAGLLVCGNRNGFVISVSVNKHQVIFKDGDLNAAYLLGDYTREKGLYCSDTIEFSLNYKNEFCSLGNKILQFQDTEILLLEDEVVDTAIVRNIDVLILKVFREDIPFSVQNTLVLDARMSNRDRMRIKALALAKEVKVIDLAELAYEKVYR